MIHTVDLRTFAREVLERHGCVLENDVDGFQAVLSSAAETALLHARTPTVSPVGALLVAVRFLKNPTDEDLNAQKLYLLHGSESLRSLCSLAESAGGTSASYFDDLYLPRERLDEKLYAAFQWVKLKPIFEETAERVGSYLLCHWRYRAVSDDRMEGMVVVAVNEQTGVVSEELPLWLDDYHGSCGSGMREFQERCAPRMPQGEVIKQSARAAELLVRKAIGAFSASMARRRERDLKRIDEYYETMVHDIEALIERRRLSGKERVKPEEQIAAVRREEQAKRVDIIGRYATEVMLSLVAAERLFVPVIASRLRVLHGKEETETEIIWNPLTKTFDPLGCIHCASGMYTVSACERWHWLCPSCSLPCGDCGNAKLCRVCTDSCARCAKKQ